MSAGNPFRRSSRLPVEPDAASANIFNNARRTSEEAASTTTSQWTVQPDEPPSLRNGDGGYFSESMNGTSESEGRDTAAGGTKAPYNPFARTLATKEAALGSLEGSKADTAANGGKEQRTKAALDVDAFKNILLTGAPVPAAGLSTTRDHHVNTDVSSGFDSVYGDQPGSPKDADHDYDSTSDDDEHSELMGAAGRSDDMAPPAPPKPNRPKGPQTVSFADFDQSIPPGFMSSRSRSPHIDAKHITGILRTASPRPGSDLNKPLPAPPRDTPPKETVENSNPTGPNERRPSPQAIVPSPPPTLAAKAAPPPPPTRKSGVGHARTRSSSNLSNTTQDSIPSTPADSVVSTASNKLAPRPPPPPSRKSSIANTAQLSAKETQPPTPEAKLVPPPPPLRRLSTKPGRANSNLSRQGSEDSTTMTASTAAAPPPPPPRRLSSKRTSLDGPPSAFQRRLSSSEHHRGTSFDSERSGSISSLQKVVETGEGGDQPVFSPGTERDILAEMSAFQAEIDALSQAAKGK